MGSCLFQEICSRRAPWPDAFFPSFSDLSASCKSRPSATRSSSTSRLARRARSARNARCRRDGAGRLKADEVSRPRRDERIMVLTRVRGSRRRCERVQRGLGLQARQYCAAKRIRMTVRPRLSLGCQLRLSCPAGQVAICRSRSRWRASMAKAPSLRACHWLSFCTDPVRATSWSRAAATRPSALIWAASTRWPAGSKSCVASAACKGSSTARSAIGAGVVATWTISGGWASS